MTIYDLMLRLELVVGGDVVQFMLRGQLIATGDIM
jgi:hypothetical protein